MPDSVEMGLNAMVIEGREAAGRPSVMDTGELARDAVEFCSKLISFDTSNFGGGRACGERAAAEWVAGILTDAGFEPVVLESAPGRANSVVRIPGADPLAPALLVHGHLDVVPAEVADWSFDPFGGEVRDGAVWGRGALDMKDMDALMLAVACSFGREGRRPPRDIVMAFVADEEDTGEFGAGFLVDKYPELFEGVGAAIGESGAFSVALPDGSLLYPIATAERGSAWMTLTASGTAGHGSRANPDNAVTTLIRALDRLASITWPQHLTPPVAALIDGLSEHLGYPIDLTCLPELGRAGDMIAATLSNSLNPTMLSAGYKHNVVPSAATAGVDGRILPGTEDAFFAAVDEALGDSVTRAFASFSGPVSADHTSPEFAAMADAIRAHDPETLVLPFCMSGGTDAKAFAGLGIPGYGFTPGRTPADFHRWNYVHGVDERVLVDSLAFGVRVLDTYLRAMPWVDPARPSAVRSA